MKFFMMKVLKGAAFPSLILNEMFDSCTTQQIRIMEDIIKAVKESLDKNI